MMELTSKLFLGMPTRGDVVITAMQAKDETGKTHTSIQPGDMVVIIKNPRGLQGGKIDKASAGNKCIFGVAAQGIDGFTVPVVTSGHVIAYVDTGVFSSPAVGECLKCDEKKCGCAVMLVQKIMANKQDNAETEAFEVKI